MILKIISWVFPSPIRPFLGGLLGGATSLLGGLFSGSGGGFLSGLLGKAGSGLMSGAEQY